MKILSLNTWGGTQFKELREFIMRHEPTTDVFCFQEISVSGKIQPLDEVPRKNLARDLIDILPDFQYFYAPFQEGFNWEPVDYEMSLANVIFVRNTYNVLEHGHTFVHGEKNGLDFEEAKVGNWHSMPRLVQFVEIEGGPTVYNFHGYWHKDGKHDTEERFLQSANILKVLEQHEGTKILCGDFNLNIDTESLRMLETQGALRNLIKEYPIHTTRNHLYPKKDIMPYADYVLVSPDVEVTAFSVPDEPVSDHLPMILEYK